MVFSENEKRYLDKLRRNNPDRDIPSDDMVSDILSKMDTDDEEVIDDLIIRVWDGIVELELI